MEVKFRDGRRNYLLYNFLKNDLKEQKLTAKYIKNDAINIFDNVSFFCKIVLKIVKLGVYFEKWFEIIYS